MIPGGIVGDFAWAVAGAPAFEESQEVVLMLNPLPGRFGEYGLSEFGLSKFDLASDERGRRFAVRPVFGAVEDLRLARQDRQIVAAAAPGAAVSGARRRVVPRGSARPARRAELGSVAYARPSGDLQPARRGAAPRSSRTSAAEEPGNCGGQPCLFRWFWDNGGSPDATRVPDRLADKPRRPTPASAASTRPAWSDYIADQWHGVAGTDVRISGPASPGNLEVLLDQDVAHNGTAWTTPYDCNNGGAVGHRRADLAGRRPHLSGRLPLLRRRNRKGLDAALDLQLRHERHSWRC